MPDTIRKLFLAATCSVVLMVAVVVVRAVLSVLYIPVEAIPARVLSEWRYYAVMLAVFCTGFWLALLAGLGERR